MYAGGDTIGGGLPAARRAIYEKGLCPLPPTPEAGDGWFCWACSWSCLTSLSEPTRNPKWIPSPPWNTRAVKDGCRLQPAAGRAWRRFLNPQEISSKMIAQASKMNTHATLKHHDGHGSHIETMAGRTGACGLQPVVPNVAFWRRKKLAPKWLLPKSGPPVKLVVPNVANPQETSSKMTAQASKMNHCLLLTSVLLSCCSLVSLLAPGVFLFVSCSWNLLLPVGFLSSSLSLLLPPCSLALAPCFLLLSASLSLALAICSHYLLPLAERMSSLTRSPSPLAGSADR